MEVWMYIVGGFVLAVFGFGIRIVRPVELGLIERLGKYKRVAKQGFHWIIPVINQMIKVNTTEQMVDAKKQEIITQDRLNATVDAQIYFKVKPSENDVMNSQYNVDDCEFQIVNLCRTTLRNIIGGLNYEEANSDRKKINDQLKKTLTTETSSWGIEIVRTELKEIDAPNDVQTSMNMVIKAENEKQAAIDVANATETAADGEKRAKIKMAEGVKESLILEATGRAESIKKVADAKAKEIELVNVSIRKHFKDNAIKYKAYETAEEALKDGTKFVIDSKSNIMNVMSEAAGVPIPLPK